MLRRTGGGLNPEDCPLKASFRAGPLTYEALYKPLDFVTLIESKSTPEAHVQATSCNPFQRRGSIYSTLPPVNRENNRCSCSGTIIA